ncbi:MAG: hypothetical protein PHT88_03815 [Candidatus Moranbacteria bacterium]|nr:hypothetical protein [Candidatus Moranbacteria bacterium]
MKTIAIIGSGVVGSATGKGFIARGAEVVFYDVRDEAIANLRGQGLEARHMDDLDVNGSDTFFFVVSTPTQRGKINLKYLRSAVRTFGKKLRYREGYCMVVIRSTVPPKTTEDILIPLLEKASKKRAGKDFGVAMNPEYLRERSAEYDFRNPWVVTVGSLDQRSRQRMEDIFSDYTCKIHYVSVREAEMQKYVHNLYNAVKIAFFNEIRVVADRVDIMPERVFDITTQSAEGFWNQEYGLKNKGPFEGTCLPKDTQAFFDWASKELRIHMDVLEGAINANKKYGKIWYKTHEIRKEKSLPSAKAFSVLQVAPFAEHAPALSKVAQRHAFQKNRKAQD